MEIGLTGSLPFSLLLYCSFIILSINIVRMCVVWCSTPPLGLNGYLQVVTERTPPPAGTIPNVSPGAEVATVRRRQDIRFVIIIAVIIIIIIIIIIVMFSTQFDRVRKTIKIYLFMASCRFDILIS